MGNIAINDAFMLEAAIYHLLKRHFRKEAYYVDVLELFLAVCSAQCGVRYTVHAEIRASPLLDDVPDGDGAVDRSHHRAGRSRRPEQILFTKVGEKLTESLVIR